MGFTKHYYIISGTNLLTGGPAGDGTKHPDEHLIYVDEVCGLFKLADMPEDVI